VPANFVNFCNRVLGRASGKRHASGRFCVNLFRVGHVVTLIHINMQSKLLLSMLGLAAGGFLAAAEPDAARILATAPLRFEPAPEGSAAQFIARGARYHFEFTRDEAALRAGDKDVRLHFDGADQHAEISGTERERSTTNLYLGNDPAKWRQGVPNYGRVQVRGLYPGIDLAYYGNGGELEYDLTVKPGATPRRIRFRLQGEGASASEASVNQHGDLVSKLTQKRPVAYQVAADGSRRRVDSRYRKNADGSYGFALGPYDHTRDLVIDPLLIAQYFSGSYQVIAYGIGHDSNGRIYIGGDTSTTDLTLAGTPYQSSEAGGIDLFFAVINPALSQDSQIIYITYIGGTSDDDFGAMQVTPSGDVYMTGTTFSDDFPTVNAAQTTLGGTTETNSNAIALWFSPTQTLKFSTYIGGSGNDGGKAISVGSNGRIWIAGNTQSTDFPNTGGFQDTLIGKQNMFIAGFDPSNTTTATETYSIYIGGTHWDEAYGLALAPDGTLWLAGATYSPDIWITGRPTYQGTYGGDGDAYVAHINPALKTTALLYASFLGGNGIDEATSMVLDPSGRLILSGYTLSSNFPVTKDAFQTTYGGNTDAFIAILDPAIKPAASQLVYSTYFGGDGADSAFDLKEDSSGVLYVSGYTESPGLPSTPNALQASYDGSLDAFGLKLDPTKAGAAGIDYFTYLGSDGVQVAYGVDFDTKGNIYLVGSTTTGLLGEFGGPERGSEDGVVNAFVIGLKTAAASSDATPKAGTPVIRRHPHVPVLPHR
jgi:Beta-propeller repeat